jgi:hypothetical protein
MLSDTDRVQSAIAEEDPKTMRSSMMGVKKSMVCTSATSDANLCTPASSDPSIPVSTLGSGGISNPQRALSRSPGPILAAHPDVLDNEVSLIWLFMYDPVAWLAFLTFKLSSIESGSQGSDHIGF